jgi:hypothetical protein
VAGRERERTVEVEGEAHVNRRQRTVRSQDARIERIQAEATLQRAARD